MGGVAILLARNNSCASLKLTKLWLGPFFPAMIMLACIVVLEPLFEGIPGQREVFHSKDCHGRIPAKESQQ